MCWSSYLFRSPYPATAHTPYFTLTRKQLVTFLGNAGENLAFCDVTQLCVREGVRCVTALTPKKMEKTAAKVASCAVVFCRSHSPSNGIDTKKRLQRRLPWRRPGKEDNTGSSIYLPVFRTEIGSTKPESLHPLVKIGLDFQTYRKWISIAYLAYFGAYTTKWISNAHFLISKVACILFVAIVFCSMHTTYFIFETDERRW